LLTGAIHFAVVFSIPRAIMLVVMTKIDRQTNQSEILHANIPNAGDDPIVRMSPDILYSSAVYDVSKNPVAFKFEVPTDSTYWSISLYDARTSDNIFAINGDKLTNTDNQREINLIVKNPQVNYVPKVNEIVIEVKHPKGVLIKRTIIKNRYDSLKLESLIKMQKNASMEVLSL
jgi:uncharacterized membrane protein